MRQQRWLHLPAPAKTRCRTIDLGTHALPAVFSTSHFQNGSFSLSSNWPLTSSAYQDEGYDLSFCRIWSHRRASRRARNSASFAASTGSYSKAERSASFSQPEAVGSDNTSAMLGMFIRYVLPRNHYRLMFQKDSPPTLGTRLVSRPRVRPSSLDREDDNDDIADSKPQPSSGLQQLEILLVTSHFRQRA